ncbi:carbohydrate ABC transporter permease [Paenibacillaceae bacterium WGS1546]|uniref:carbohydrate ABC transporter permease n=1 Tax=Cohnella sp. WGS1546 TaxID=3366810 RepID=UPI00372D1ED3
MSLRKEKRRETIYAYGFLLPSLLLFSIFLFYPMARSIYYSLHLTDPRGQIAMFVGFENFVRIFTDSGFYVSLLATAKFMLLTVPTCIFVALVLAVLSHNKLRGMGAFQWIFSMPVVISVATGSAIWLLLFHPSIGMLNYFLGLIGIEPIYWLVDPNWALVSVSLVTVWMNIGFAFIVLLGGLKGIPPDIYESSTIDGAGPMTTLWRITFPMLSPTLLFLVVISIINAFQAFGQIHILTKGGPLRSTEVVVYSIYQDAFVNFQFGTASAKAIVLFAIILLLTLIQFAMAEKKVHYQ